MSDIGKETKIGYVNKILDASAEDTSSVIDEVISEFLDKEVELSRYLIDSAIEAFKNVLSKESIEAREKSPAIKKGVLYNELLGAIDEPDTKSLFRRTVLKNIRSTQEGVKKIDTTKGAHLVHRPAKKVRSRRRVVTGSAFSAGIR